MANIVCECGSTFPLDRAKDMEKCPVCGKLWNDSADSKNEDDHAGWITWYYYGQKDKKGRKTTTSSLRDKPIDLEEFGDTFFLIKEFKAPPRDS